MNMTPEQKAKLKHATRSHEVFKLKLESGAASPLEQQRVGIAAGLGILMKEKVWEGKEFERAEFAQWLMQRLELVGGGQVIDDLVKIIEDADKNNIVNPQVIGALSAIILGYVDAKADQEKRLMKEANKFKEIVEAFQKKEKPNGA